MLIVLFMVFKVGVYVDDFLVMYLVDLLMILVNLVGFLVISVFCGFSVVGLLIGM